MNNGTQIVNLTNIYILSPLNNWSWYNHVINKELEILITTRIPSVSLSSWVIVSMYHIYPLQQDFHIKIIIGLFRLVNAFFIRHGGFCINWINLVHFVILKWYTLQLILLNICILNRHCTVEWYCNVKPTALRFILWQCVLLLKHY